MKTNPSDPFSSDPVLLEVIWARMGSIVTEQAANVIRTSFSPIVREAGDVATALFDRKGRMLAHGVTGTPGHLIPMTKTLVEFLKAFPAEGIGEGDIFITNDPWQTTGHQFDVTIANPVFSKGKLIGFFASTAHHADMGGLGFGANANDVFEEGLIIPIMRLQHRHEPDRTLVAMIRANVREPDAVIGDLNAQVAANETAAREYVRLLDDYGVEDIDAMAETIFEKSEAASRAAIREVPNGTYSAEMMLDGFDSPIRLFITLTIHDDYIEADFEGTSPQVRKGINVCLNYTSGYTAFALRLAIGNELPHNFGSLAPFKIRAPEGTVVSCTFPAPVSARHMVGQMVPNLVLKALAKAVPDKVMADGAGSVWGLTIQGTKPGGRTYASVSLISGGVGARPTKDGLTTTQFPTGTRGVPIEVTELEAPVLFRSKTLLADSGGGGRFRGGLGQRVEVDIDPEGGSCVVNLMCDKTVNSAEGMLGGLSGATGAVKSGAGAAVHPKSRFVVSEPLQLVLDTPGAGGYGDPFERSVELVLADVEKGFVTPGRAASDYGVVVSDGAVDVEGTRRLRNGEKQRATA
jgi:N-methylhydantoinase B